MNTVVYTALYGHYFDTPPAAPDLGVPAVCFTDDPELRAPGWEMRVAPRPEPTHRLQAKWFKLHPDECLPEFDVSIWVDAGWQIVSPDFAREAAAYLGDCPAAFFPHRWHKSIMDELAASTHPKMAGYPLHEQVQCYLDQGLPADAPVLECTSIVRRHNEGRVVEMDRAWWWENANWSECDQLSLPFVLWKTNLPVALFPFTLSGQPWLRLANWRAD